MSDTKERIEITDEMADEGINLNEKPAAEWMEETKYKIYMDLVDLSYKLLIEPDIKGLAEKYGVKESTVKRHINNLQKENLVIKQKGKNKGKITLPSLFVGRKGQPVCAICGSELEDVKEKVTKSDYYVISGKCPVCQEGTGQSRCKATVLE